MNSIPKPIQWAEKVSRELVDRFLELRKTIHSAGRLDEATKRLCLISAYAAVGCAECLAGAIKEGLRMGIELEKMLEAASIAVLVSGAQGVMTVYKALTLLEKEEDH